MNLFLACAAATIVAPEGHGLWQKSDCTWIVVPCPAAAAYEDRSLAVRLPQGCSAPEPRVSYSIEEDLAIRAEFSGNRAKVLGLEDELSRCRARSKENLAMCEDSLVRAVESAKTCKEDLQGCALNQVAQNDALLHWKIAAIVGAVLALGAGFAVGGLL